MKAWLFDALCFVRPVPKVSFSVNHLAPLSRMPESNPYVSNQAAPRGPGIGRRRLFILLMAIGSLLILTSLYLYFFSETMTFYSPYSDETRQWIVMNPIGADYSIDFYLGFFAMLSSAILGLILITLSLTIRAFTPND